jgi:hypothetical protein
MTAAAAAAAEYSNILSKKNKHRHIVQGCCCSICGKKLKFSEVSEYPLACWKCMIANADF